MSLNNGHLLDISDIFRTNIGHGKKCWAESGLDEMLIKAVIFQGIQPHMEKKLKGNGIWGYSAPRKEENEDAKENGR